MMDSIDIDTERYHDRLDALERIGRERDLDVAERTAELLAEWEGAWGDFFAEHQDDADNLLEALSLAFDQRPCDEREAATRYRLMRNAARRLAEEIAESEFPE